MPYPISLMHICKNALAAPRPMSSTPSAHFYGSAISERDKNAEPLPTCLPLPLPSTVDRDSQSGASGQGSINKHQGFNKTASSPAQFFPRDVPRSSQSVSLSSPNYVHRTDPDARHPHVRRSQTARCRPRLASLQYASRQHHHSHAGSLAPVFRLARLPRLGTSVVCHTSRRSSASTLMDMMGMQAADHNSDPCLRANLAANGAACPGSLVPTTSGFDKQPCSSALALHLCCCS